MKPTIVLLGGFHDDPGSRAHAITYLRGRAAEAPHVVAVEWDAEVFAEMQAARAPLVGPLRERWPFLSEEAATELTCSLAWEGDAHEGVFPGAAVLWLDGGVQAEALKRRHGDQMTPKGFAQYLAGCLLQRLGDPTGLTMAEWMANAEPPPEPTSIETLVDRVTRKAWSALDPDRDPNFPRDRRWAELLDERLGSINGGWAVCMVGWAHADPGSGEGWLRDLLERRGYPVESVRLGP